MYECIINPSSHSGRGGALWKELRARFEATHIPYRVHMTDGPGAAIRTVRALSSEYEKKEEPLRLVILGGDGTLNEAVSGITDFSRVLLGYIPTGSSNDFARGAGLPRDPRALFKPILAGRECRRIDVGRLVYHRQTKTLSRLHDESAENVRHFVVSAGIGFDAAVCEEALSSGTKNFFNRIGLGKLTYGAIAMKHLLGADWIGIEMTIDDGRTIALDHFLFAAMMLEPYEGGGFRFAPDADNRDGFFNICLIGDMSKPRMITSLPLAYLGKHYGLPGIYHYRTQSVRIRTALPMWVHTDGEVVMKSDDIELTCLHQALSLMI
ncbi:MAG: diacylglycerol kinase family lipid kinase [Lachnospiraceae bacterium]|nr:diacylglycerol kinase family lipid kinase [Lachnospiraceae bacterium]